MPDRRWDGRAPALGGVAFDGRGGHRAARPAQGQQNSYIWANSQYSNPEYDGIINQIDPGGPSDKDLYDLPPEEARGIPTVCHSLDQALEALDNDRDFLKAGGVFSDDFIDGYIALKMGEVTKFRAATHPLEYAMYYGI